MNKGLNNYLKKKKKSQWHSIMNKAYVNIWPQLYLMFYCFKGILKQLSFKNTELVWC